MLIFHFFFFLLPTLFQFCRKGGGGVAQRERKANSISTSSSLPLLSSAALPTTLPCWQFFQINYLSFIWYLISIYLSFSLLSSAGYHPPMLAIFIYFTNFLETNRFPAIAPSLFVPIDISSEERVILATKYFFSCSIISWNIGNQIPFSCNIFSCHCICYSSVLHSTPTFSWTYQVK